MSVTVSRELGNGDQVRVSRINGLNFLNLVPNEARRLEGERSQSIRFEDDEAPQIVDALESYIKEVLK
jgi:hypothetical protein